jgi:hypothetical protein
MEAAVLLATAFGPALFQSMLKHPSHHNTSDKRDIIGYVSVQNIHKVSCVRNENKFLYWVQCKIDEKTTVP